MRFEGKVAIITGSGRGIGRATAMRFAREGGRVVINDVDPEVAEATAGEIKALGGDAIYSTASVTDRVAVKQMVDDAVAAFGTVDILVNNAGITSSAPALKMSEEVWDKVLDVCLKGVFNCSQAVGALFVENAQRHPEARCCGKIVNIASVAGLRGGLLGQANYGAAKAGVIGLTMSLAREWARYRVSCNAVAFGVVVTRLTERIRTDPKLNDKYLEDVPLHRYAEPEEVAGTILFMASPDSDYITGHTLNVTGGGHIGF